MPPSPHPPHPHPHPHPQSRRKRRRRPSFLLVIACLAVITAAVVVFEQQRDTQRHGANDRRPEFRNPGGIASASASDPNLSLGASLQNHNGESSDANKDPSKKGGKRVFDVNAPPNPQDKDNAGDEDRGKNPFSLWGHHDSRMHASDGENATALRNKRNKKLRPFPVLDDSDDQIPVPPAKSNGIFVASDALLCPKNVIDFVINATDSKDECVMLTKAFEKHCTAEEGTHSAMPSRRRLSQIEDENDEQSYYFPYNRHGNGGVVGRSRGRRRKNNPVLWWQAYFRSFDLTARVSDWIGQPRRRRLVGDDGDQEDAAKEDQKKIIPQPANNTAAPKLPNENRTQPEKEKPKISLTLPTTSHHMSEKAVSETLLLHSEDAITAMAKAAKTNQTNLTDHTEAAAAAAASQKALSDAFELIQTVLNDPSSIEARACCGSILSVYHENCEEEELSDSWLFIVVLVLALCGLVKSLIRYYQIRWLPEAAGCILVGLASGWTLSFFPHHDISFDGDWFLRVMVPPIVFEAALGINKHSFKRHAIPIVVYAIVGTLFATGLTAFIVHEGTLLLRGRCETIPYIESLTFGALISSIDPIAVLSVLSNMGMTDTDTIYVLIFGESLLNDGVAIVLFQTLVHFLDERIVLDKEAISAATVHFLVVALGSLFVGAMSGLLCTVYFWLMRDCQTPLIEVLMFFCWALIPYYICDGIEWSGIVSVVAAGFVMDIGVVGERSGDHSVVPEVETTDASPRSPSSRKRRRRPLFLRGGHMGAQARAHIGFVTEIIATAMETAIFAYLGLFLFSSRYHWNVYHTVVAILGCCLSRAVMIPCLSFVANNITRAQSLRESCRNRHITQQGENGDVKGGSNNQGVVIVDKKMQLVLWFAGLRGAMSFALVEDIPLYDSVTGEGSRLKSELKAMTSASILFTIFVLGGCTFSMMEAMGMAPSKPDSSTPSSANHHQGNGDAEMASLLSGGVARSEDDSDPGDLHDDDQLTTSSNSSGNRTTSHFQPQWSRRLTFRPRSNSRGRQ